MVTDFPCVFASSHLCLICHFREGLIAWSCATKSFALASASSRCISAACASDSTAATCSSACAIRSPASSLRFCSMAAKCVFSAFSRSLAFLWPSFTPTATPSTFAATDASASASACLALKSRSFWCASCASALALTAAAVAASSLARIASVSAL